MSALHRPCTKCLRIRVFLACAVPLILMIYLRPAALERLAQFFPSPMLIGIGFVVASFILLALRLRAERQKQRADITADTP